MNGERWMEDIKGTIYSVLLPTLTVGEMESLEAAIQALCARVYNEGRKDQMAKEYCPACFCDRCKKKGKVIRLHKESQ